MFLTIEADMLGIVINTVRHGCCEDMNVALQLPANLTPWRRTESSCPWLADQEWNQILKAKPIEWGWDQATEVPWLSHKHFSPH